MIPRGLWGLNNTTPGLFSINQNYMRPNDIEKRERLAKRNTSIRSDYAAEHRKGYRLEVILQTLETRYAVSVASLEDIVFSRGKYKEF
mgnify:CR=1 FL=1